MFTARYCRDVGEFSLQYIYIISQRFCRRKLLLSKLYFIYMYISEVEGGEYRQAKISMLQVQRTIQWKYSSPAGVQEYIFYIHIYTYILRGDKNKRMKKSSESCFTSPRKPRRLEVFVKFFFSLLLLGLEKFIEIFQR